MKKLLLFIILLFSCLVSCYAQVNSKHISVKGYTRKDGTYVKPHVRTAPNSTNRDNFSTQGNINPYTGKPGNIIPDNNPLYKKPPVKTSPNTIPNARHIRPKPKSIRTSEETFNISSRGIQPNWIKKKANRLDKKYFRKENDYHLKLKAHSKRQQGYSKNNLNLNIEHLSDGWYNVNYSKTVNIRNKPNNVLIRRQIFIQNGRATKYIGEQNMIFGIHEFIK